MNPDEKNKNVLGEEDRGKKTAVYSPSDAAYRSRILDSLQMDYVLREQSHMELDDKTYSEYYLINRQQDMAYKPPRRNPSDSRIVSGITHEKDSTIVSIIDDMNFQPKFVPYDKDNEELSDATMILTALVKKSLVQDNFKQKLSEFARVNTAQGNVFIEEKPYLEKFTVQKIPLNESKDPTKMKWKTVVKKEEGKCSSILIPNTAVFMPNLLNPDLHSQDHIWVVMHVPVDIVAAFYKDFPNWDAVPMEPTKTVPQNVNGLWGDYYLQQPQKGYIEVAMYQSESRNEYNVLLNGTMMYPAGFPLTHFSVSGKYTLIKGDNERIPFFAYGKSVPSKTEVKEETQNELMRLMVYKMRQAAKPPVGNNSDKVLPSNIWDPGVITPDIKEGDISIMTPNAGITVADFSFYKLISESISASSISDSLEGQAMEKNVTLGQFTDQKKASLMKLGLTIDGTINFLREIYWMRLFNEIQYISTKVKKEGDDGKIVEAYQDFMIEDVPINGTNHRIKVNFVDDNSQRRSQDVLNEEEGLGEFAGNGAMGSPTKIFYVRPKYLQDFVKKMKDKMYVDVVSEPEGQDRNLLAVLFNLLTQYANLRGGVIPNLNFEYLDKVIGQSSGLDWNKIFVKAQPAPAPGALGPDGQPILQNTPPGQPAAPAGKASAPVLPQNPVMNKGYVQ